MKTKIKQMYVSIELVDSQVKILINEYFNTRFNVVKVLKSNLSGMNNHHITDRGAALKSIQEALSEAGDKLGARIEKCILIVPPYKFKRMPLKVNINTADGSLKKEDVVRAVNNALKIKVDNNLIIVDVAIIKYTINGITTRRFPENEICDEVLVDIDLLLADKETTYSFVSLLEESGIRVLDVCLNSYAIAKEAALLEQGLSHNLILLNIGREETELSLISKGKLITTEIINEGFNNLINVLFEKYRLPETVINRLLKYNVSYKGDYLDDVVYAWKSDNKSYSLTSENISNDIKVTLNNYVDKIIEMSMPIIESGNTQFVLTGEGAEMKALSNLIKEKSNVDVRTYYPDTIGIRESSLSALFGASVAYHDKVVLENIDVNCVDLMEYESIVDRRKIDVEGDTITSRIKNLFKQYRNKEES